MDATPRKRVAHDRGTYLGRADLEGFEKYAVCLERYSLFTIQVSWSGHISDLHLCHETILELHCQCEIVSSSADRL
jgi:hypothetical protein